MQSPRFGIRFSSLEGHRLKIQERVQKILASDHFGSRVVNPQEGSQSNTSVDGLSSELEVGAVGVKGVTLNDHDGTTCKFERTEIFSKYMLIARSTSAQRATSALEDMRSASPEPA